MSQEVTAHDLVDCGCLLPYPEGAKLMANVIDAMYEVCQGTEREIRGRPKMPGPVVMNLKVGVSLSSESTTLS